MSVGSSAASPLSSSIDVNNNQQPIDESEATTNNNTQQQQQSEMTVESHLEAIYSTAYRMVSLLQMY